MNRNDDGRARERRHGDQVGERIERHVLYQEGIDRNVAHLDLAQRVAVGRTLRHRVAGEHAARAAAVLHHYALAEAALEVIGHQPRRDVHQAARRGGDDEAYGFAWIFLRLHRDRADRNEQREKDLHAAAAPGVVGAALHQHIAGLEEHFGFVEHRVALAGKNDRVVERFRAVHAGMAARRFVGRFCAHAEYRAAGLGLDAARPDRRIPQDIIGRGPQLGEAQAARLFEHDRLRLVFYGEDGAALGIVAGDDALHLTTSRAMRGFCYKVADRGACE